MKHDSRTCGQAYRGLAKVAFIDIETAPTLAWIWKRFKENISESQVEKNSYLLCAAWSFLGGNEVHTASITDFHTTTSDDDSEVVRLLHSLLDDADIVVAHNARKFDLPTLNSRFVFYGLRPPSPYRIIDTLEAAKRNFRFPSNALDSLGRYLGLGRKEPHHFELWHGCLHGDKKAWRDMVSYCAQDIRLLKQVYSRLLPYMDTHPNLALYDDRLNCRRCPKCGSTKMKECSPHYTPTQKYISYKCDNCGGLLRDRLTSVDKEIRGLVPANVSSR